MEEENPILLHLAALGIDILRSVCPSKFIGFWRGMMGESNLRIFSP
jgi:hypothetical protein